MAEHQHQDVGGVRTENSGHVFPAYRTGPVIDEALDLRSFVCHDGARLQFNLCSRVVDAALSILLRG